MRRNCLLYGRREGCNKGMKRPISLCEVNAVRIPPDSSCAPLNCSRVRIPRRRRLSQETSEDLVGYQVSRLVEANGVVLFSQQAEVEELADFCVVAVSEVEASGGRGG